MEKATLREQLRRLQNSLQQIESFLAWERLKQSERYPARPPAFQIHDPTEADLRNEFSSFLASLATLHESLDAHPHATSSKEWRYYKRQLLKLEQAIHALNLHRRFWRG